MDTREKDFAILAVIVGVLIILWFWWEKRNATSAVSAPAPEQDFENWPMEQTPDYTPQSIPDITIGNQTPNLLSQQYIPLFGFVGVAQGTQW